MAIELRPYQNKAIEDIKTQFEAGKKTIIVTAPTGSG